MFYNSVNTLILIFDDTFVEFLIKNSTHFRPLSRNLSNSTDILQQSARRLCEDEHLVLIMWPSESKRRELNVGWACN